MTSRTPFAPKASEDSPRHLADGRGRAAADAGERQERVSSENSLGVRQPTKMSVSWRSVRPCVFALARRSPQRVRRPLTVFTRRSPTDPRLHKSAIAGGARARRAPVEQRHRDPKQTVRVRPVCLPNNDRIEGLLSVIGIPLLILRPLEAHLRAGLVTRQRCQASFPSPNGQAHRPRGCVLPSTGSGSPNCEWPPP